MGKLRYLALQYLRRNFLSPVKLNRYHKIMVLNRHKEDINSIQIDINRIQTRPKSIQRGFKQDINRYKMDLNFIKSI